MQGSVYALGELVPNIAGDVFIAPGAQVIGDVTLEAGVSIWFNVVLRGDVQSIHVGAGTNIQDGSIVHVTSNTHPTRIGRNVLVGHLAMLHGCTLEDEAFVGMAATVMDGCVVEQGGMVAAGALLTPGKRVGKGQMWAGRPARFVRDLSAAEIADARAGVGHYRDEAQAYRRDLRRL